MNFPSPIELVILDRDGVINQDSDDYIKSPGEWVAIPGSLKAIAKLNAAGYLVAVATNQSGVGRGYYSEATLNEIHTKMLSELTEVGGHIDALAFCPHTPDDHCECRKPKPQMYLDLINHFGVSADKVVVIGDNFRDLEAAWASKCHGVLVRSGKGEKVLQSHADALKSTPVYRDLAEAVNALLNV